jgi:hypothetical protein
MTTSTPPRTSAKKNGPYAQRRVQAKPAIASAGTSSEATTTAGWKSSAEELPTNGRSSPVYPTPM